MNFIKKNKVLCGLFLIAFVFAMTLVTIVLSNIKLGNNVYGNRLNGIEEYPISNEQIDNIKNKISESELVSNVNYEVEGKLMNFIIYVDDSLLLNDAKNLSNAITEILDKKLFEFYDIQVLIDSNNEESEIYPIAGYKHKTSENFVWKQ